VNLLVHGHLFPPNHYAGAEMTAHAILRLAQDAGHEARMVAAHEQGEPYSWEGVWCYPGRAQIDDHYRWADVVLTYLDEAPHAGRYAATHRVPVAYMAHNDWWQQLLPPNVTDTRPYPVCVVHPPIIPELVRCRGDGRRVTLMNVSAEKGGHLLYMLAQQMPDVEFLGVLGAYGEQVIPPEVPENLTYCTHGDARQVYALTRLLIMPSEYESYGRCALEAAHSGIPAAWRADTGLEEAMAGCGVRVVSRRLDAWRMAVTQGLEQRGKLGIQAKLWADHAQRYVQPAEVAGLFVHLAALASRRRRARGMA
jgi:hypothetical protein